MTLKHVYLAVLKVLKQKIIISIYITKSIKQFIFK